ncbi:MAG TPA: HD-GYP domain-containing protein [Gallionella sp.]|nr:HD-GYP domain-containing protein [Gallionella sp.]
MIKKVRVDELQPGMFIHDLNCGHVFHPLLHTQFHLDDTRAIDRLIERGVSSVYIDTRLGRDAPDAPTAQEVRDDIDQTLLNMAQRNASADTHPAPLSASDIDLAHQVYEEASLTVHELMTTTRLGKHAELEQVRPAVQGIVDSIFRNADPLLHLGTIRNANQYLFYHSVATCSLLSAFAQQLGIGRDITRQLAIGAMLHDIGKTRIAESILDKPGRLTDAEFDEIKRHVEYGMEILADAPWLTPISLQVVAQHHERYDGGGYPAALKSDHLSQYGQMAAIVDVYDAITSARSYHAAMEPVEAIRKLREWSEQHFNVELVDHFICCVGIYPTGTLVRLESGLLGIVATHNPANQLKPAVLVTYDTNRSCRIKPYELDLATQSGDRIVGYESAEKWGIDPNEAAYLMAPPGQSRRIDPAPSC